MKKQIEVTIWRAFVPVLGLILVLLYGLVIQPHVMHQGQLPLEVIFLFATSFSVTYLVYLGFTWQEIQEKMVGKLSQALPAIFILYSIGILVGSWVVSGTIPMLIYYGLQIINPHYIYLVAFVVPIIFSTATGTSWGSAGTVGVVIMGIAHAIGADLAITAGAVVGGAYFGDKISPLSDTTNVEALATNVDLYAHIRSMLNTTVPSTIIAAILYFVLGRMYPPSILGSGNNEVVEATLRGLDTIFNFNILLLLPIAVVLYGAWTKKPTVPSIICSSATAIVLALIFQDFHFSDVLAVLNKGFSSNYIYWETDLPKNVIGIINRGGLYSLNDAIVVCIIVFLYIGTLEMMNSLPVLINHVFAFVKTRAQTISTALIATAVTNAMTSNQFATSFIVGAAFIDKFDKMRIPRKVLSRTLADTGTMLESMIPWTTTGLYMSTTLGVAVMDYNRWQLLTLTNIVVAFLLAYTGWGCFYHEVDGKQEEKQ